MIDVKLLREQPDLVRSAIANKKFNCDIDAVLELDKHRREKITEAEKARERTARRFGKKTAVSSNFIQTPPPKLGGGWGVGLSPTAQSHKPSAIHH